MRATPDIPARFRHFAHPGYTKVFSFLPRCRRFYATETPFGDWDGKTLAAHAFAMGDAMSLDVRVHSERQWQQFIASGLRRVDGRHVIMTPFMWPGSLIVPFDTLLCTRQVDRMHCWQIRTWRWAAGCNYRQWQLIRPACEQMLNGFDELDVSVECTLEETRMTVVWPRFNQVLDFKLRPDHERIGNEIRKLVMECADNIEKLTM